MILLTSAVMIVATMSASDATAGSTRPPTRLRALWPCARRRFLTVTAKYTSSKTIETGIVSTASE